MSLTVAVIGTGSIGMRYLTLLKQQEGVVPVAIPKRKERRGELESQGWQTTASLREAVAQGAKLAIIATNTSRHTADALEALAEDMDLLVEKPLSVDAVGAAAIDQAARQKNRKLFVGCVLRCSESLQTFREWLPKVGNIYAVRIECQSFLAHWRPNHPYRESYSARTEEGGVLRDLIHEIDYATWLFGWPQKIQAQLKNTGLLEIEAEEFAQLWWETDRGISVSLCLDYLSKIPRRKMTAFGERGILEWDGMIRKTWLQNPHHSEATIPEPDRGAIYSIHLKEWIKACLSSEQNVLLASGQEGVRALSICDAARKSAASQKAEIISYSL